MRKKIVWITGLFLMAGILWYLFIKTYDYEVTFTAKALPGTINQTLKLWMGNSPNSEMYGKPEALKLEQRLIFNDSVHAYAWELQPLNDSMAKVRVYAKDIDHSLNNKVTVPFTHTDFEQRTIRTVGDFQSKLQEHLNSFKVTYVGRENIRSTYCAYVPLKSTQFQKAGKMMENYPLLDFMMAHSNIGRNGSPFIEITKWNREKDSITYNFCYPIIQSDSLPDHPLIKYKQYEGGKALKAIYNGNYITSDRAWYTLIDYADKHHIKVTGLPVEIFYSNPNLGGDVLEWKAEIYMPLKE